MCVLVELLVNTWSKIQNNLNVVLILVHIAVNLAQKAMNGETAGNR